LNTTIPLSFLLIHRATAELRSATGEQAVLRRTNILRSRQKHGGSHQHAISRVALDVGLTNPLGKIHSPYTRSEIALPLWLRPRSGALMYSPLVRARLDPGIETLQGMANQFPSPLKTQVFSNKSTNLDEIRSVQRQYTLQSEASGKHRRPYYEWEIQNLTNNNELEVSARERVDDRRSNWIGWE